MEARFLYVAPPLHFYALLSITSYKNMNLLTSIDISNSKKKLRLLIYQEITTEWN